MACMQFFNYFLTLEAISAVLRLIKGHITHLGDFGLFFWQVLDKFDQCSALDETKNSKSAEWCKIIEVPKFQLDYLQNF